MGRLVRQKGFDLLLEAFAQVPQGVRAGWKLGIIGEGPLRAELTGRIESEGLQGQAMLLGRFSNPLPLLRAARFFVLSSRYEGFPTVLVEALACGLPAVAFDCPCGPSEIVRNGTDGLLVPPGDVQALATAMARLMADSGLLQRLAERSPEALERFSERRYLGQWEALIRRLTAGAA
jgi:glycosyltransferase involved in cell wall biosynthesis